ncbi:hypothetical protein NA57DRAFT_60290 [Rhizodiscina lignyota]|uniref:BRCT domain-containing protein n=1 Tax=Rhizodiscina lignyota TaxID=1504668 RepID=A0A9P4M6J0_9PEZI|nr:hypothetical protein NA57DRAFT_60290 [Rhizodiscina lignyota]
MGEDLDITVNEGPLFEGVYFTIIPSPSFKGDYEQKIFRELTNHGAEHVALNPRTGCISNMQKTTHIISATSDFADYSAALEKMKHVVKPSWVETCVEKGKTTNPRQFSPDPCMIFSDIVLTCADIPEGDVEAIQGGLIALGGLCSGPLTKTVTHIVALSMDNEMCSMAKKKNLKCKIVLPHWFDDCLKLKRKIDERPYLLPDPELLRKDPSPMKHNLVSYDDIQGATDPSPREVPDNSTSKDERTKIDVFKGKKIMISADLDIRDRLLKTLEHLVKSGGGSIVNRLDRATVYICKYRDSYDFASAYKSGKEIGNLSWLYYLNAHNTWTSPTKRLLHYPMPRHGIPGFEDMRISISNYTGEARIYLESLVNAAGGQFTKTMKQENTHLITAHMNSEKCEAAREWNIHIVNHLWLEESYAKCEMQTMTNPRYTTFPSRTNLGEVIGQTQIDLGAIQDQLGENPQLLLETNMMDVDQDESEPVLDDGGPMDPPSPAATATRRQKLKKSKTDNVTRTPAAPRFVEGKENETPSTTGSRRAKERAISHLHDAAKDIAQYEKESKRVGGVTHGRPRSSDGPKTKEVDSKKRQTPDDEDDDEDEEPLEDVVRKKGAKRAKTTVVKEKRPPIGERLMVTKYEKWLEKPQQEAADRNKLRNLGIHITESPADCTILCAPRIVRTRKFVTALATAPRVVSTDWLDSCLRNNKIPAPKAHLLLDRIEEGRLGIKIDQTLERAKKNNRKLLRGWQIFCTEGVTGGWETYKDIIEANGGMCNLYKGRSSMTASKRSFTRETQEDKSVADNQGEDEGDTLYLISGEGKKDKELWSKFKELAKKEDMVPRIVKGDWLLHVAMNQKVVDTGKNNLD